MIVERYFYQTVIKIANAKGYRMKNLAEVCHTKAGTLDKQLRRTDSQDISTLTAKFLNLELAPNLSMDELYPESAKEAGRMRCRT